MGWPCLVLLQWCTTPILLEIEPEGLQESGEPFPVIKVETTCNYQDKAKTVMTAEKKLIEVTGSALFPGDICPVLPTISGGSATVFGEKRRILQGTKARNPDGSVNYTEVLLV